MRAFAFNLQRLRSELKPFRLYWFPRLRSTNDHAALLRKRGKLFAPAIVLTANQVAGRGRGDNTWWSTRDVLTVTFAMPIEEGLAPQELPLIAGLSVRNAAAALTANHQIELKWPNDVLHENRKLAGLLCERVNKIDLIGIGLNMNLDPAGAPRGLRDRITSLLSISGHAFNPNDVLIAVAKELAHNLRLRREQPFSTFVRKYHQHDALTGKTVTITPSSAEPPITGRCEGIDDLGRLIVRTRRNVQHILAGHVEMQRD